MHIQEVFIINSYDFFIEFIKFIVNPFSDFLIDTEEKVEAIYYILKRICINNFKSERFSFLISAADPSNSHYRYIYSYCSFCLSLSLSFHLLRNPFVTLKNHACALFLQADPDQADCRLLSLLALLQCAQEVLVPRNVLHSNDRTPLNSEFSI